MKYHLILEYDGTKFDGWKLIAGKRTVEGTLLVACKELFPTKKITLVGAVHTETGMHAMAQSVHLDMDVDIEPEPLGMMINEALPDDVSIIEMAGIVSNFEARKDAIARSYLYTIATKNKAEDPRFSWLVARDRLKLNLMQQASKKFIGVNDYKFFLPNRGDKDSTKFNILSIEVFSEENVVYVRIKAPYLVDKLARLIVGVLVEVGCMKMNSVEFGSLFQQFNPRLQRLAAPVQGLFLEDVYYHEDDLGIKLAKAKLPDYAD